MPRVPVYEAPQEQLRPLGKPETASVATPELLGARARQDAQLAQGVLAAGTGVTAIAAVMQERENADVIFRAETAIKDNYLKYEQEVRKTRQGRFAKDLTKDTGKWWDDQVKEHSDSLGNAEQRRLFQQRASRLREQSLSSVSAYEAGQLERSHDEAWKADKNATISTAAATPTADNVDTARMEIERLNRYQAARKGWEGAQLEAEIRRDKTALHKQVIQGLVRENPLAAKSYFEKYKSEIDGADHAEIGAFAEKASANALGEAAAAAVWEKAGPKSDRTPVELDKMEDQLREALKGNEPALDASIKRLRERVQAFKDGRRERDEGLEATVNKAIMGGATRAQVARMPEFLQLSPETARKIDSFMENKAYTQEARAAARASRAEAEERRTVHRLTREGLDTALRLSDPRVLSSMTRDQVVNLLPQLGPEHTSNLVAKWDSFNKDPEKLTEATIDKQDFDTIALSRGLRPNEKGKSEPEKDQLVRLQSHVETVIGVEQKAKGRRLSREEKRALMERELDNQVIVDRWGPFNPKLAVPLLTEDELKTAYVFVGTQKVKLSSIPATERGAIIKARQARGLPVTEQLIAETWLRAQQKGK